ncbi:hypothetical protein CTEN210_17094 [Chaetoceros tenuissimus]|uniref:Calmodulin n=1 Tax=Chaetoceros tenuissimus TaxID=426638 RepID=A0AAD3HF20_9STRA|nr:hypothetical protein CTEN210_17094 [Chaetoceros tenuissimus]
MKISLAILALASSASAFAPAFNKPMTQVASSAAPAAPLRMGGDDEEGGLDLNLEEMFDMFDAADKEEEFDDAIKKVKKDE